MNIDILTEQTGLEFGGIQNTSFLLAEYFQKLGNNVILFNRRESVAPKNVKNIIIKKKKNGRLQRITDGIEYAKQINKNLSPDIILCTTWHEGIGALLYKFLKKKPYIVMAHGNEVLTLNKKLPFSKWVRKIVLDKAELITANSEYTRILVKKISTTKSVIINPPILFKNNGIYHERTNIMLSIGRSVERKGFQDVINAMPELIKEFPNLTYRIAGDGEYQSFLIDLSKKLNLESKVVFLGRISEKEKEEELKNCDILIMPSHIDEKAYQVEGFGIVYIEANMYGKWVIARNMGGVRSAVLDGVTGRLIDNSRPSDIIKAVSDYYSGVEKFDVKVLKSWSKKRDVNYIGRNYLKYMKKILNKKDMNILIQRNRPYE